MDNHIAGSSFPMKPVSGAEQVEEVESLNTATLHDNRPLHLAAPPRPHPVPRPAAQAGLLLRRLQEHRRRPPRPVAAQEEAAAEGRDGSGRPNRCPNRHRSAGQYRRGGPPPVRLPTPRTSSPRQASGWRGCRTRTSCPPPVSPGYRDVTRVVALPIKAKSVVIERIQVIIPALLVNSNTTGYHRCP